MVRIVLGGFGIFAGFFCLTYLFLSYPSTMSFVLTAIAAIAILFAGWSYMYKSLRK